MSQLPCRARGEIQEVRQQEPQGSFEDHLPWIRDRSLSISIVELHDCFNTATL